MNVGFIGTGSMGSILIEAFIQSESLRANQIIASNRTRSKVQRLADQYPELRVAKSNADVILESQIVFLCIKPKEFKQVIDEIHKLVIPSQVIVSITSPVLIQYLEDHLCCKIAKVIPSITNYQCSGAALCMYGERITADDQTCLENMLRPISTPLHISEHYTRISSDLSSCGPAFIAFFVEQFVLAAVQETGIPHEQASRLASEMVLGTGKLLTSGGFTPASLQQRVSVPGGITAEGLRIMAAELDGVFNELIQTTHAKFENELEKVRLQFYSQEVDCP